MKKANIPDQLIAEECFTELELIASLLKQKKGLETFLKISKAAQIGTVKFNQALLKSGMKEHFAQMAQDVVSKKFAKEFLSGQFEQDHRHFITELRSVSS
jgi:ketol-acid reductoisomerase